MSMNKRLLAVALGLSLLISLAACSNQGSPSGNPPENGGTSEVSNTSVEYNEDEFLPIGSGWLAIKNKISNSLVVKAISASLKNAARCAGEIFRLPKLKSSLIKTFVGEKITSSARVDMIFSIICSSLSEKVNIITFPKSITSQAYLIFWMGFPVLSIIKARKSCQSPSCNPLLLKI